MKTLLLLILALFGIQPAFAQTFSISETGSTSPTGLRVGAAGESYNLTSFSYSSSTKVLSGILKDVNGVAANAVTISEDGNAGNSTHPDNTGGFTLTLASDGSITFKSLTGGENKFKASDLPATATITLTSMGSTGSTSQNVDDYTKLAGILVTSFGEDVSVQPTLLASQAWVSKDKKFGAEARISAFQKNKDTTRYVNATNLFKPEISNFHLRFAGDYSPFKDKFLKPFGLNFEINFYNQQLNDSSKAESPGDINSFLTKVGLHSEPLKGVIFYANFQYYNVLAGTAEFEKRFGTELSQKYINLEMAGQFQFTQGLAKGLFIQPTLLFNTSDTKDLAQTKDPVVFFIKAGFSKFIE